MKRLLECFSRFWFQFGKWLLIQDQSRVIYYNIYAPIFHGSRFIKFQIRMYLNLICFNDLLYYNCYRWDERFRNEFQSNLIKNFILIIIHLQNFERIFMPLVSFFAHFTVICSVRTGNRIMNSSELLDMFFDIWRHYFKLAFILRSVW